MHKETLEKNKEIKIYMLGRFSFEYDGQTVLEDEGKIHKVWTLLGFLLSNHNRRIGTQELPELLCGDDRSNNPTKAVKNLVYRLRCMLSDSGLPEYNYVVQTGGIYGWNNDLSYTIDTEEFMDLYNKAKKVTYDCEKAIELYLKAIDLYKGKFLPHAIYDEWAVTATTYYHRIFTECVFELYNLIVEKREFHTMIPVCEKAISIDSYDEAIYRIYIYCLAEMGRHKEALEAYESITNRLYDELGVNPSSQLRALYREIIKTIKSVETDLITIKEDLNESGVSDTCYYCEYQIFKDIYRFIARRITRTGESIYIMLCTITDKDGEIPSTEHLSEAMSVLKNSIGKSLRKCDLFARYSHSQYVVMLLDTSYENGQMVGRRIESAYKKNKKTKMPDVHYKLQPLDPKDF